MVASSLAHVADDVFAAGQGQQVKLAEGGRRRAHSRIHVWEDAQCVAGRAATRLGGWFQSADYVLYDLFYSPLIDLHHYHTF
jgi:hypothetical protein